MSHYCKLICLLISLIILPISNTTAGDFFEDVNGQSVQQSFVVKDVFSGIYNQPNLKVKRINDTFKKHHASSFRPSQHPLTRTDIILDEVSASHQPVPEKDNLWYKTSTWRNLIDMHIPDWNPEFLSEFSPEEYAQSMVDAKVDASIIYAGNCLGMCFWPTKVGHMHKGLKGRDINSETINALHKQGIKVIVYFNIWNRWAYDTYPSWRMIKADGRSTTENADGSFSRFGQCCMNNEGYRSFVSEQITDLSKSFDCDGLWIDMIGYFGTVCYCGSCRDKYLAETGREIPKVINWDDPKWVDFVRSRERWFDEFAQMIQDAAHNINPDLTLAFQTTSLLSGWGGGVTQSFLNRSDYLAGDFYGQPMQYSVICKYLNNLTRNRPIEFMTSRCYNLEFHTTTKTDEELRSSVLGAYAHNAAFTFIDAIDPIGTIDRDFYRRMGRIKDQVSIYQRAINPDAEMISDVGFYLNFASAYNPAQNGVPMRSASTYFSIVRDMQNIGGMMVRNNILYDFIGEPQLDNLNRYSVIVLPNQYVLSDDEIRAFRRYVSEGGNLVVTGESGMNNMEGNRLVDFALSDVLGVHYKGQTEENRTYIAPTVEGQVHFKENDAKYPLALTGPQIIVKTDPGIKTLATITLPYSSSGEIYKFGSAISNPPAYPSEHPSVTLNSYGKGQAMYIAAPLEKEILRPQQQTFASLIGRLYSPRLSTNAPRWLESIVFRDSDNKRYQLTLNNISDNERGLIAYNINVTLEIPEQIVSITDVATGQAIKYEQEKGKVDISIEELKDFSMLLINFK